MGGFSVKTKQKEGYQLKSKLAIIAAVLWLAVLAISSYTANSDRAGPTIRVQDSIIVAGYPFIENP